MRAVEVSPSWLRRYQSIGGILDFNIFENASTNPPDAASAIEAALLEHGKVDGGRLRSLGGRRIDQALFLGGCFDPQSGALLHPGTVTTTDGTKLHNPRLTTLDRHGIACSSHETPVASGGGQFAYAFAHPPYPLRATGGEVQALFDRVRGDLLPPWHASEIHDWGSPHLPEVSSYFDAGMEWWGVFLFTIHLPELQRLVVIAGSATD